MDFIVVLLEPFACVASAATLAAGVVVAEVTLAVEAIPGDWSARRRRTAASCLEESSSGFLVEIATRFGRVCRTSSWTRKRRRVSCVEVSPASLE